MTADPSDPSSPQGCGPVSSEGGRRPTGEDTGSAPSPRLRWSALRKSEIVLRLLKGESVDALTRETQQTAAKLTEWRDAFLTGAESGLKGRPEPDEHDAHLDEKRRLQARIGELAMEVELLYERCHKLEAGLPPAQRRSKR